MAQLGLNEKEENKETESSILSRSVDDEEINYTPEGIVNDMKH